MGVRQEGLFPSGGDEERRAAAAGHQRPFDAFRGDRHVGEPEPPVRDEARERERPEGMISTVRTLYVRGFGFGSASAREGTEGEREARQCQYLIGGT